MVMLHGYSDSTLALVTSSAETRLYPDQTDMSCLNIEDYFGGGGQRGAHSLPPEVRGELVVSMLRLILVAEDKVGHTPCRQGCHRRLGGYVLSGRTLAINELLVIQVLMEEG
jgi:hypothetical protein